MEPKGGVVYDHRLHRSQAVQNLNSVPQGRYRSRDHRANRADQVTAKGGSIPVALYGYSVVDASTMLSMTYFAGGAIK